MSDAILTADPQVGRSGRGIFRRLLRYARRRPLGAFSAVVVIAFVVIAVISPWISPYDPRESVADPLQPPSWDHWLGTNSIGEDVLSRTLVGSQISLAIGFTVVAIGVVFTTLLGLLAGYFLGPIDYIIQRSGEIWTAFPELIALLLIVSIFGAPSTDGGNLLTIVWDMRNLVFAFSIGAVFGGSRIIRGVAIQLRNSDYVLAARAMGASDMRIVSRHLLPNVMHFVILGASLGVGGVILGEAALSFLGLGVAPGTPSWGQDLSGSNRTYFREALWMVLAPGGALTITVLSLNLFGDALRDLLDPRLRGG
jgi:peptide/nickel transport system permease protein